MSKVPSSTPAKSQTPISQFFAKKNSSKNTTDSVPSNSPPLLANDVEKPVAGSKDTLLPYQNPSVSKRSFTSVENSVDEDVENTARSTKRLKNNQTSLERTIQPEVNLGTQGSTSIAPKISSQAEHYLYKKLSPTTGVDQIPEGKEEITLENAERKKLHELWVKKLGHARLGQNRKINEEAATLEEDQSDDEDESRDLPVSKGKKKTGKLTPLEIQFLEIKKDHMDTILIVEVGYKFKFFGEDARLAARELSIVCIPGKLRFDEHPSESHFDRFASASIPVHRISIHAKRLVQAGYKIGIVRQIETAALKKAGDNRNTPFTRKLTSLYTKGTYIDEFDTLEDQSGLLESGASATEYLICVVESLSKRSGTDEKVDVGFLAVQPATGDIIYDSFEDGFLRGEIETRLLHLPPSEILIVGNLTKTTEKIINNLSGSSNNTIGEQIRVERIDNGQASVAEAISHISQFYGKLNSQTSESVEGNQNFQDKILLLPEKVKICLSAMISHLSEYGLDHVFDLTKNFEPFSVRSHMLLNGNTLASLEIFHNQTEHTEKGSLFWVLDKTQTRFGRRMLRKWVGRPLLDQTQLEERLNAVEELKNSHQTLKVDKIYSLLRNTKTDLERNLIRIYYGKCTRPELLVVLQALQAVATEYGHVKADENFGFTSPLLCSLIRSLHPINDTVTKYLSMISIEAARSDDKYAFFHPDHESEDITDHKMGIAIVEQELDAHRHSASASLKKSKPLPYMTAAGIEYLFEISNSDLKRVPVSWTKVSGTKKVSRFHTPEVIQMLQERGQHKESLAAACDSAFARLLSDIAQHYVALRETIHALATLDCLGSLARVAQQPGYNRPHLTATTCIEIYQGRHPMVEQLLTTDYIPNTTRLTTTPDGPRALCITGPNMGGKSSYVRHIALLVLMAQIGSYLPCESACLGLVDAIYTRMGAADSIFTRQSTFHVELSETAAIMQRATSRSLVILDELGRGTSTQDGVAIAESTLDWIVREKRCLCLFITHYQSLAAVAHRFEADGALKNVHMKFTTSNPEGIERGTNNFEETGHEEVTFLYEVGEGVAHRSYGLNVARLAHIPKFVLDLAAVKSREMEMVIKMKRLIGAARMINSVFKKETDVDLDELVSSLAEI
ncbi:DNA mismatch repair protein Msh3/DNA mismatch repair protein msh3 [Blumeria hordei DH14]|uniref:DNA mismatch repair protein n=1 Tax=Blumeria graminis f. sp. hordei (strain DH14) TaxID=546991 RepID=N1J594_BLUG1|nr:DNA mismatch repair protein Msh3/DNA mismatch repair protein msh3 [Blumeria hordei DH14]